MYSNDISLNASTYRNLFSSSTGRLYVPVKASVAVFTQFDYVRGTPAGKGEKGVSVDRIRILNTLFDQLVSMRKKTASKEDLAELSDSQKDALINTYQKQVKDSFEVANQISAYGLAGFAPEAGAVFDIMA